MHQHHPASHPNRRRQVPRGGPGTFAKRLTILVASLLASALATTAPEPAVASLAFCNRTSVASTLTLALAYYKPGLLHVRSSRNAPDLSITLNPRWKIRGWWEIPQNECVTAIHSNLSQKHYYYYVHSPDDSYELMGDYGLCGHQYSRFHLEYAMNDDRLVEVLALKPSGIDSVPADSGADLEKVCADLGYEILPFNQLDVGENKEFTLTFID